MGNRVAKKVQASGEDEKDSSPQVVREINVVVLGAKGVGKTELIAHYRKQPSSTHVHLSGLNRLASLTLQDEIPKEDYEEAIRMGHAFVVLFTKKDEGSLEEAMEIINTLKEELGIDHWDQSETLVMLVENKEDNYVAAHYGGGAQEALKEVMEKNPGLPFFRCSAKTGLNVVVLFQTAARSVDLRTVGGTVKRAR